MSQNISPTQRSRKAILSTVIALSAFGLAYAPLPGLTQKIVVVSGTELSEPLQQLEARFEQEHPNIDLELKFQGSQDMVNNYIDEKNDFTPTVLIPASQEILGELQQRWQAQNSEEAFYQAPQPVARTFLVGIAWPERGQKLFPSGQFSWQRLEQAMQAGSWEKIAGQPNWGSFDFVMTDPTRSNSGQVSLSLWTDAKGSQALNTPQIESLFETVKRSVYQPPRSTDILLQEFITRGPNDADVATVYESIALNRWDQSRTTQGKPYQIYYLDPTVETVSTAAIVQRGVSSGMAKAGVEFVDFLNQPEQQQVFVQYGFRPVNPSVKLDTVPNSPWSQNIPGAQVDPQVKTLSAPQKDEIGEIQRLWQRVQL
ncbi:MAG: substrate-binding domain-containing protein [Microcoleaceae cyanobacterium]